ncbi:MAG: serine hydrolase domain-containing protein [Bacteroidota bacterium]
MKNTILTLMASLLICLTLYAFTLACKNPTKLLGKDTLKRDLLLDSLDQELQAFLKQSLFPGIAFSIVNEKEVVFQKGYGSANLEAKKAFTPQSIQPIASISKTFVGVALLKLVDQGKLDLDEAINDILPYPIIHPQFPDVPITVRHLATHTSGISNRFGENGDGYWLLEKSPYQKGDIRDDMYEFIEIIAQNKALSLDEYIQKVCLPTGEWHKEETFLPYAPGTRNDYSNIATAVAGRIIELKSGMSLQDFSQKHIFQPLGMKSTAWTYDAINKEQLSKQYFTDDPSNPSRVSLMPRFTYARYPAGHLITNIEDMSLYLMEMINGFQGNGELLSSASYQFLLHPQLDNSHYEERYEGEFNGSYDVGIFWGISSTGLRMHDGGEIGVYSFMYFDPKTGFGGLGMMNARINSFGDTREIIRKYEKRLSQLSKAK